MTQKEYKLTYYNLRGLGEPIRLIFAYAGVEYKDERIPMDAEHYPKLPEAMKNELPFGTLPVLEVDGKRIAQSVAICRYLAKQFNLSGKDDFETAKCDEIVGGLQDFHRDFYIWHKEADPERKAVIQKDLLGNSFPMYMSRFEKMLTSNGGKYYVGENLTWLDIYMAHFMEMSQERFPGSLDKFPGVKAATEGILALPKIKQWVETRPKDDTPPSN